jgi:RND family efflux transporter MFP subunit
MLQIVLPLAVLGMAGLAALTMIENREPVEVQVPVITPPGVRVEEVTLGDTAFSVTSQGTVRPRTESQLVPEIAGRVTWVAPSFAEGGFFELGDVLLTIDPFDYQQAIVSSRSQLAQARLRLAQEDAEAEVAIREWEALGRGDPRALTLREPQLEEARAAVAGAEAGLERAKRDLERAEIVAPYAGRIREKNVDIGQYVRVGEAVATIFGVDVAEVRLPLPDDQLAYLDLPLSYRGGPNQPQPHVTLRATFAGEAHEWQGRIVRTESEIDPVSRMVLAVAEVVDPYAPGPNRRPPLAVGMFVEAEIVGRLARDVAIVPRAALRGGDQVLVVDVEDRVSFRTIDVLRTSTDVVYVASGLIEGELIVVSPLDTPVDGMRVQVANVDANLMARQRGVAPNEEPAMPSGAPTRALDGDSLAALTATNDAPAPDTAVPDIESNLSREEQIGAIRRQLAALRGGTVGEPDTAAGESRLSGAEARAGRSSRIRPGNPGGRDGLATRSGEGPGNGLVAPDAAPVAPPSVASAADRDPVFTEPAVESAEPPGAVADTERSVAVLPFVNLTRNPGDDWMSSEMTAALRIAIEETGAMGIVALASTDQSIALESAGARSAVWLVGGGFQRIGDRLRITARVLEVSSGVLIGSAKVSGTVAELDTLIAEMVDTVQAAVDGDESAARTIGARSFGDDSGGVAEVAAARRSS